MNTAPGQARLTFEVMNTMKLLKPMLVVAGASLLATGCVYRERTVYRTPPPRPGGVVAESPGSDVEVVGPPPPAPPPSVDTTIVIGPNPYPDGFWIAPYWAWGPRGWYWHDGYWGHRPRGAVWIGPRVEVRGGRHYWVEGRWR